MKASELKKVSIPIENLYNAIESDNKENRHKHIVPFGIYVSDEVRNELMTNGFKLSFDHIGSLIIEW